MKRLLRYFAANLFALYLVTFYNSGFTISGGGGTFLYAALLLSMINMFIKPLLKILFLPINLITLGFFSWVINIFALYLLTLIVPQIRIDAWTFSGFQSVWFSLPSFHINNYVNFILCAISLSIITEFMHWLYK